MKILPNLIKNQRAREGEAKPFISILQTGTQHYRSEFTCGSQILQDHVARSSLSPVSPFLGQVPADQKARQQASTQDQLRV